MGDYRCRIGLHCYHPTGLTRTVEKKISHGEFEPEINKRIKHEEKCCQCGKTVWVEPLNANS